MANITVIVPVHQLEEKYIVGCIESIKNQRVKPFEVLFVTSDDEKLNDYLNGYDFGELKNVTKVIKNETGIKNTSSLSKTDLQYQENRRKRKVPGALGRKMLKKRKTFKNHRFLKVF